MNMKILEGLKIVNGLAPSADIYNGNPASDVVSLKMYDRVVFLLQQKTAGSNTGTAVVTVEACNNLAASVTEAIPFKVYKNESADTTDDLGAAIDVAAAGFTTVANKTSIYAIEVQGQDLPEGKPNVRLKLTEGTNDPVLGSVLVLAGAARVQGDPDTLPTAIA